MSTVGGKHDIQQSIQKSKMYTEDVGECAPTRNKMQDNLNFARNHTMKLTDLLGHIFHVQTSVRMVVS